LGIKPLPEALSMARAYDLDLVEVAGGARPPVCKIMDFAKFKYEEQQRAKESRKKATNITVKEMKYRPKISGGDFDTKTRKVAKFLGEGHKVKVTIMFRGREMQHPELGRAILDRVAVDVEHLGRVENHPRQDGRNMTMVLGPDKKAQAAHKKKLAEEAASESPAAEQPVVEDSVVEDSVVEESVVEESVVDESAAGTPAVEEAAAEAPATDVTAPEDATSEDTAPEEPVADTAESVSNEQG
jgi:translation initiation factor IF-3